MPNTYFQFKEFRIDQALSGMKVTTDACLFGAWIADELSIAKQGSKRVLDIGTGTGLLPLMLVQKIENAQIEAVEINKNACSEAIANFHNSPWRRQLTCHHSAIQDYKNDPFDVIICNPPFFQGSSKGANNSKNQALHSSHLSMDDLFENILKLLSGKGSFYLLYPAHEMNQFISLARKSDLFPTHLVNVRNQEAELVFRKMAKFEFDSRDCRTSEIIIRTENGKYTDDFWHLLKDYYLEYNNPELH